MTKHRRRKHLIKPRLQLLYVLVSLSTASLYVLLQAIMMNWMVSKIAADIPGGEELVIPPFLEGLRTTLLVCFLVLVPMTVAIGVLVTFRVAGPIYRFERFLEEIIAGGKPGPCRLRKGDELQDFCDLLNRATEPLRRRDASDASGTSEATAADVDAVPSLAGAREHEEQRA